MGNTLRHWVVNFTYKNSAAIQVYKIYLEIDKVVFLEKKGEWWTAGLVKHETGLPLPEHLRAYGDLLLGEYTKWVKNLSSGSLMYDKRRGAQDRQMECELICIHQVLLPIFSTPYFCT